MIFGARDQGGIAAELSNDHAYFSCRSSLATSAGQKDVLQDKAWSERGGLGLSSVLGPAVPGGMWAVNDGAMGLGWP